MLKIGSRKNLQMALLLFIAVLLNAESVYGGQELLSVENGVVKIAQCSSCNLLALEAVIPGICPVTQELTATEVAAAATTAAATNTQPFTFDELYVCCTAASSASLLLDVIRYSNINELTLDKCTQDFSASTDDDIVIYGLEKVTIISDTSSDYPRHSLDYLQSDEGDTTTQYSNYHMTVLHRNLLQGSMDMGSFSLVLSLTGTDLPAVVSSGLQRAPLALTSKGDGTFMMTAVYGK